MQTIEQPVPDLELGIPRQPVRFDLRLPSGGLRPDTGLVFYIHGWGARYDDAYAAKLLPYLADRHNCVAVSVDYQGSVAHAGFSMVPAPDFFAKLAEHHGVQVTAPTGVAPLQIAQMVLAQMAQRGITQLHPECAFLRGSEAYSNFGLLPALDHLQVLHRVQAELPLDKRRIYVIGTSYGGYVAMMAAKLAPNSFKLVVDNSGFSSAADTLAVYGMGELCSSRPAVRLLSRVAFSPNPANSYYLTPSMRRIRAVGVDEHYSDQDGVCASYGYHSAHDNVAPLAAKVAAAEVVARHRRHDLKIVTEADIDGCIFKATTHGMHASLRGLFDMTMERWRGDGGGDVPAVTDFDLETVNVLPCGDKDYIVSCSAEGVSLCVVTGRQTA